MFCGAVSAVGLECPWAVSALVRLQVSLTLERHSHTSCCLCMSTLQPVCRQRACLFVLFVCRYTAAKRFGLEGCETLIPGMKGMIDTITDLGCKSVVIGMPHRGMWGGGGQVTRVCGCG